MMWVARRQYGTRMASVWWGRWPRRRPRRWLLIMRKLFRRLDGLLGAQLLPTDGGKKKSHMHVPLVGSEAGEHPPAPASHPPVGSHHDGKVWGVLSIPAVRGQKPSSKIDFLLTSSTKLLFPAITLAVTSVLQLKICSQSDELEEISMRRLQKHNLVSSVVADRATASSRASTEHMVVCTTLFTHVPSALEMAVRYLNAAALTMWRPCAQTPVDLTTSPRSRRLPTSPARDFSFEYCTCMHCRAKFFTQPLQQSTSAVVLYSVRPKMAMAHVECSQARC